MQLQHFASDATADLRTYLETATAAVRRFRPAASRFVYPCVEAFVLAHGRPFETRVCKPHGMWAGLPRCCFQNAAVLATICPERYTYVEGYAIGVIPVLHAWVMDADGNVLDITWPEAAEVGAAYWGVPLKAAYVKRTVMALKGAAIDNAPDRFPLLTGAHPLSDALAFRAETEETR